MIASGRYGCHHGLTWSHHILVQICYYGQSVEAILNSVKTIHLALKAPCGIKVSIDAPPYAIFLAPGMPDRGIMLFATW